MFLQQFVAGFFVKSVASFDATLTRVSLISELTRTMRGKVAFSIGTLIALSIILTVVIFFSSLLSLIPYPNIFIAILILVLAFFVYFELLLPKPEKKVGEKINLGKISSSRLLKLMGIGFLVSFVTLIDDSIILTSLFVDGGNGTIFAVLGIYAATLLQLGLVIYFGDRLKKIKYKKELASISLVFLAILVLVGVI